MCPLVLLASLPLSEPDYFPKLVIRDLVIFENCNLHVSMSTSYHLCPLVDTHELGFKCLMQQHRPKPSIERAEWDLEDDYFSKPQNLIAPKFVHSNPCIQSTSVRYILNWILTYFPISIHYTSNMNSGDLEWSNGVNRIFLHIYSHFFRYWILANPYMNSNKLSQILNENFWFSFQFYTYNIHPNWDTSSVRYSKPIIEHCNSLDCVKHVFQFAVMKIIHQIL